MYRGVKVERGGYERRGEGVFSSVQFRVSSKSLIGLVRATAVKLGRFLCRGVSLGKDVSVHSWETMDVVGG